MSLNFKASDLLKDELIKRKIKKKNYKQQLQRCLETIKSANENYHKQFLVYNVPYSLIGEPNYDPAECTIYIKEELRNSEFAVDIMKPGNILFISWKPEDVEKVQKKNAKKKKKEEEERQKRRLEKEAEKQRKQEELRKLQPDRPFIEYDPKSRLSTMKFTADLIRNNSRYSNLKSVKDDRNSSTRKHRKRSSFS